MSLGFTEDVAAGETDRLLELRAQLLDAAEGLRYLHSRVPPICHGDVKGVSHSITMIHPWY